MGAIRAGFRRLIEEPPLIFGEIAWRWSFAAAAIVLLVIAAVEWLDSIVIFGPVPAFGPRARLGIIAAILLGGFGLLSSFAAGLGRSATVPLLFRSKQTRARFAAQLGFAFLRAALILATLFGYMGAWTLAQAPHSHFALTWPAGRAFAGIFLPLALLVTAASVFLQFILTLASLYASSSTGPAVDSICAAAALLNRRTPEVATIAVVFLLLRALVLAAALTVVPAALEFARDYPAAVVAILITAAVIYAAISDFLLISRLAAYAALIEDDLQEDSAIAAALPAASL